MRITKAIWNYFGQTQPVFTRVLHLAILLLTISQLITSDFVDIEAANLTGGGLVLGLGTWAHVAPGLILVVITSVFTLIVLVRHGLKYFFPYVWGEFSPLTADVKQLVAFKLPDIAPGGIAAIVQGLGLGAMALTLASGLMWFLLMRTGSGMAHTAIEAHETFTGLVVAYLIGHGGIGILHMIPWIRGNMKSNR
ncbi:conserved membrane hypothetical protein [Desulfosarcina cetonica]|uniref:hypothetical protein n=1 Tax=Desulfosarcina cetonica TaxID=90730 RepID=UPI0006D07C01|nr:hypothetical protein [Desulfosarcina cetonica]VTR69962.1 conserved membrane hypothetical protein [Desulfosarcina cetonica]